MLCPPSYRESRSRSCRSQRPDPRRRHPRSAPRRGYGRRGSVGAARIEAAGVVGVAGDVERGGDFGDEYVVDQYLQDCGGVGGG